LRTVGNSALATYQLFDFVNFAKIVEMKQKKDEERKSEQH
jgi:hypothetical protein